MSEIKGEITEEFAKYLQQEFGYVPNEAGGEKWTILLNHSLIVIHSERRPRIYKRGCGGSFYEIEPNFP